MEFSEAIERLEEGTECNNCGQQALKREDYDHQEAGNGYRFYDVECSNCGHTDTYSV